MTQRDKMRKYQGVQAKMHQVTMGIVKIAPWVEIELKGGTYKLEYTLAAVLDIYRKLGINVNTTRLGLDEIKDIEYFPTILFAGLQEHHDSKFADSDTLTKYVQVRHMLYYATCILQALEAAQPDAEQIASIMEEVADGEVEPDASPLVMMPISSPSGQDVPILEGPMLTSGE